MLNTLQAKKKYLVSIDNMEVEVNDEVVIQPCKPISKRKRWAVINIIKKNS